jgi:hypothetical protein
MMSTSAVIRAAHEPKNYDTVTNYSLSTTAGTLLLLNDIVQGSGGTNRTGRQVHLEHLRLALTFYAQQNVSSEMVRYMVLLDKECRGAAPAIGDVLNNTTFGLISLLSSHNFDNVPTRFKILADEVIPIQPTVTVNATNTAWNNPYYHRLLHIKLKSVVHYYNTSVGTVADIDQNSMYLIVWGDQSVNATSLYVDSRLVFRDL